MDEYIKIPEQISAIAGKFGNITLYVVGGYVRNSLLGFGNTDLDVCSAMMPEDVLKLFGKDAVLVNEKLGTVHIKSGDEIIEHTTFRSESYPSGGFHTPEKVRIGVSLEEDAFRRDFTMNALYAEVSTGKIIDPTGRGVFDIRSRNIMTTSADPFYIMKDDGLRILRMVRLGAQLNFYTEESLNECVKKNIDLLDAISPERIYQEIKLILLADMRYPFSSCGHRRAALQMKHLGLLKKLFPVYPYNSGSEADTNILIDIFSSTPPDFTLRLASLFLMADPDEARTVLENLKVEQSRIKFICSVISEKNFGRNGDVSDPDIRRQIQKMGTKEFEALTELRRAEDIETGRMGNWRRFMKVLHETESFPCTSSELAVNGKDLMQEFGIRPSPILGEIISGLMDFCAENPLNNKRDLLLSEAKRLYTKLRK